MSRLIHPSSSRPVRRGLSIIELLVSLAITSMLLTAVAASFQTSAKVVEDNDEFFRASQAARVSLNQILVSLRQAYAILVVTDDYVIFNDENSPPQTYCYVWRKDEQRLEWVTGGSVLTPGPTLARNITDLKFEALDSRLVVTMTVQIGRNSVTMTGSVIPRKKVDWTPRETSSP